MGKPAEKEPSAGRLRLADWVAAAGGGLASVFLPAGCRLCQELLTGASRLPICSLCLASFPRIAGCICRICGLPIDLPRTEEVEGQNDERSPALCEQCRDDTYHFDCARSFARYEDSLVRAIVLLKFEEMDPLADWFADRLAEVVQQAPLDLPAEVIVPVPLHKDRHRERGFNQAELLSKRLARRLRLSHQGVLLVRKRPRPNKLLLTNRERWEAVRGAFATRPGSQVDNKRVLLVDDVMTTGATLDACAKALREAGATSVAGLTVARAILNPRTVGR